MFHVQVSEVQLPLLQVAAPKLEAEGFQKPGAEKRASDQHSKTRNLYPKADKTKQMVLRRTGRSSLRPRLRILRIPEGKSPNTPKPASRMPQKFQARVQGPKIFSLIVGPQA